MKNRFISAWMARDIDWLLFISATLISLAGLATMNSFVGESRLFERQAIWLSISILIFFTFSFIDWRFLRRTRTIMTFFAIVVGLLGLLFLIGTFVRGAQSWFNVGLFAIQPSELAKMAIVLVLSKYFTRRHVEIAHVRHIIVSGLYMLILFLLVFLQPDFGSAIIIFTIWFGMVLVSGISKKHLFLIFTIGLLVFGGMWSFGFTNEQKSRITAFLNPLADIQGAGYHSNQSMIAVGSGEIFGKGIGYGTQSKLQFLPEYETDFIFAAFAEEWGFIGVVLLFSLFSIVMWRILSNAIHGSTNFEILFGSGIAIFFMAHFIVHVGMNVGLLPITGTTIPLMSYGGSHLLIEFAALGILMGMRRYRRAVHKERVDNEIIGVGSA